MDNEERIKKLVREQKDYVIRMRRYFHENPELGEKEQNTHKVLCEELTDMGIPFQRAGEYGLIGRIDSGNPGKTLLIRSDMDGLPITEDLKNLAGPRTCVSKTEGVSHLCGHDGHMAVALGTAKVLCQIMKEKKGSVLLCFEQAEEHGGGIDTMLECLKPYSIDYSYAIHLYAGLNSGLVSVQQGPRMASVASFLIRIKGKGGHGSRPDLCLNPAGCVVDIISMIPGMMKARLNPAFPVVFSIGEIKVGTKSNIIASEGFFSGTLRYFDYEAGKKAMELICQVAEQVAQIHGCCVAYDRKLVTNSAVINDPNLSDAAAKAVNQVEGLKTALCEPWYATESFGRYQQFYPGVLALVGIKNPEKGTGEEHHNPRFDVDEEVLPLAVEAGVRFVNSLLQ